MLSPFEQVDACKDAQEAEEDEGGRETYHVCCEGAEDGTGKKGEVEDDGVPRKVGGALISGDVFEHVIGVRAIDQRK